MPPGRFAPRVFPLGNEKLGVSREKSPRVFALGGGGWHGLCVRPYKSLPH